MVPGTFWPRPVACLPEGQAPLPGGGVDPCARGVGRSDKAPKPTHLARGTPTRFQWPSSVPRVTLHGAARNTSSRKCPIQQRIEVPRSQRALCLGLPWVPSCFRSTLAPVRKSPQAEGQPGKFNEACHLSTAHESTPGAGPFVANQHDDLVGRTSCQRVV